MTYFPLAWKEKRSQCVYELKHVEIANCDQHGWAHFNPYNLVLVCWESRAVFFSLFLLSRTGLWWYIYRKSGVIWKWQELNFKRWLLVCMFSQPISQLNLWRLLWKCLLTLLVKCTVTLQHKSWNTKQAKNVVHFTNIRTISRQVFSCYYDIVLFPGTNGITWKRWFTQNIWVPKL